MSIDTLCEIAGYFDVTVDYLIGKEDNTLRENTISKTESELVMNYRKMGQEDQRIILEMAKSFSLKK